MGSGPGLVIMGICMAVHNTPGVDSGGNYYLGSWVDCAAIFHSCPACLCSRSKLAFHIYLVVRFSDCIAECYLSTESIKVLSF
ncbi:hypothetical protein GOP47_0010650 [Adiantum capillus-veneris]|uniref:Uncharacterized protein n=1 Tax=Adiantum capillus-veneris TaxID=13818 RepID=A0A9D4UVB2_ADICA|nr:hypothetical protein GOP47_0010650 [Adiantum capillus-veneris]